MGYGSSLIGGREAEALLDITQEVRVAVRFEPGLLEEVGSRPHVAALDRLESQGDERVRTIDPSRQPFQRLGHRPQGADGVACL